jgi:hypothetical protein
MASKRQMHSDAKKRRCVLLFGTCDLRRWALNSEEDDKAT